MSCPQYNTDNDDIFAMLLSTSPSNTTKQHATAQTPQPIQYCASPNPAPTTPTIDILDLIPMPKISTQPTLIAQRSTGSPQHTLQPHRHVPTPVDTFSFDDFYDVFAELTKEDQDALSHTTSLSRLQPTQISCSNDVSHGSNIDSDESSGEEVLLDQQEIIDEMESLFSHVDSGLAVPVNDTTSHSLSTAQSHQPQRPPSRPQFNKDTLSSSSSTFSEDSFVSINSPPQPITQPVPSSHVIPSLYTIKQTHTSQPKSLSCFVDLTSTHAEGCSVSTRFSRDIDDPCSCGMINIKDIQTIKTPVNISAEDVDIAPANHVDPLPHIDHTYLQHPIGGISSTQITLEQKNDWLTHCLTQSHSALTESPHIPTHIRAFTLTFNYYDAIPNSKTISSILPPKVGNFELYCFSFQECGNVLKNPTTPSQVSNTILQALNTAMTQYDINHNAPHSPVQSLSYKLVGINNLQSLYTIVIARTDIHSIIHHVQTQCIPTGFMDLVGNKGSVVIRFFIGTLAITVVGCHFAAGQNEIYKRNSDYHRINAKCNLGLTDTSCIDTQSIPKVQSPDTAKRIASTVEAHGHYGNVMRSTSNRFKYNHVYSSQRTQMLTKFRVNLAIRYKPPTDIDGSVQEAGFGMGETKKGKKQQSPEEFYEYKSDISSRNDITIWLGDFNYRIGGIFAGNRDHLFEYLLQHQHTALISRYDQLLYEKDINANIWHGYKEGIISHPPTYKYDVATQTFDTSPKQRIPSWTDRILFSCTCSQCFHEVYNLCDCKVDSGDACVYNLYGSSSGVRNRLKKTHNKPCQRLLMERYGSIQACTISDHRPVFGYFYINLSPNNSGQAGK